MLDGGGHARGSGRAQGLHRGRHHCRRHGHHDPLPARGRPGEPATCDPRCGAGPPRPAVARRGHRPGLGPTRAPRPPRRHRDPPLLGPHRQRLANSFYSAAVQAGSASWKAFFFGSSDAANSITVDKPPASLWVMALSVRLLGLSSFAILLPAGAHGRRDRRVSSTPRSSASSAQRRPHRRRRPRADPRRRADVPVQQPRRPARPCSWRWAPGRRSRRSSRPRPKWLMIVGVFIGLGFLTKTLQVAPRRAVLRAGLPRRGHRRPCASGSWHSLLGRRRDGAVGRLVGRRSSSSSRPRPAPTSVARQTNSFLELTFGYNGLGRITGDETGSVGGGGGATGGGKWGATGLGRMFNAEIGGQISWLIPSALILLVAGLWLRGRRPRTDTRRAAYLVWGGWLARHGAHLLADGRHLPRVLHRGPRPGHRCPRRHGRRGGVGAPATRRRRDRPGRGDGRGRRLGLHPPLAHGGLVRLAAHLGARGRHGGALLLPRRSVRMHRRAVPSSSARRSSPASPARRPTPFDRRHRAHRLHRRPPARPAGRDRRSRRRWRLPRRRTAPAAAAQRPRRRAARRRAARSPAARPGGAVAAAWAACSTPRRRARPSSRPLSANAGPATPGSPRPSARRTPPGCSSARSCRSWPSAASTAATRHRRWRSSRHYVPGRQDPLLRRRQRLRRSRAAAAGTSRRRSPPGSRPDFTPVTIGGSTFYDLTQPASSTAAGTTTATQS